ncbi:hypothetical protein I310019A7_17540 [Lawsonibacter asaccharolyticus]
MRTAVLKTACVSLSSLPITICVETVTPKATFLLLLLPHCNQFLKQAQGQN